jgi:hypothetical protein
MTPHQTEQRGIEARRILDSEVFKDALTMLDAQIVAQWKTTAVTDKEGAMLLLQLAKIKSKFESIFVGLVETGKFATHQISLDAERNESKARRLLRRVL